MFIAALNTLKIGPPAAGDSAVKGCSLFISVSSSQERYFCCSAAVKLTFASGRAFTLCKCADVTSLSQKRARSFSN